MTSQTLQELVGKLKDLSDYFEPNDLSASTIIREAAAAITALELELELAGRTKALKRIADGDYDNFAADPGKWADIIARVALGLPAHPRQALAEQEDRP